MGIDIKDLHTDERNIKLDQAKFIAMGSLSGDSKFNNRLGN